MLTTNYYERTIRNAPGQYNLLFYRKYNYEQAKYFKINQYPSNRKPDYYRPIYTDEKIFSPAKYENLSRYTKVNTLKELGKSYHALNLIRGVPSSSNDVYYVVENNTVNRLDKISLKFYNNPDYWWVIAHANNIFDCFTEIELGKRLRIPALSSIYNYYV